MTTIRVASFNIRNGLAFDGWQSWPFRRRSTVAAIAALDADVIGLQEVYRFQLRYLAPRLDAYRHDGAGRVDGRRGEWCPVLVRRSRVEVVAVQTRWYGAEPDRPGTRLPGAGFARIATIASLRVDGRGLTVVNTHLDEADAGRRLRSVELLLEWIDPATPTVVTGDLNASPASAPVRALLDAGFTDALAATTAATSHGFTGRARGPRIDHIFVDHRWRVASARIADERHLGRLPSDHWPVVADLTLS